MSTDDITKENPEDGWYRRKIGRRIERGGNLALALLLGAIGVVAGLIAVSDGIDPAHDWPTLAVSLVMLVLAGKCWRSKRGLIEMDPH